MIQINLALKKNTTVSSDKKVSFDFISKFSVEKVKDFPLRKMVAPILFAVVSSYFFDSYKSEELAKLDADFFKISEENRFLQLENAKSKDYELLKKQFDEDEKVIKSKLDTIKSLLADRGDLTKTLVELSKIVPQEVWISSLKVNHLDIELSGTSIGFGLISDFMKNINESASFMDVELKQIKKSDEEKNIELDQFDLKMKRR